MVIPISKDGWTLLRYYAKRDAGDDLPEACPENGYMYGSATYYPLKPMLALEPVEIEAKVMPKVVVGTTPHWHHAIVYVKIA